jgi:hypothetical protein
MPHLYQTTSILRLLVRRLVAGRRGVTAIVTAIGLGVLLGFAGLAVDVAVWLNATRSLQSAADQAAYSAAGAAGTTACIGTVPTMQATAIAAAHGYVDGRNGVHVAITCTPSNSTFTVLITELQPMWFARLFLATPPRASGRAVALLAGKISDLCVLALDGTNVSEGIIGTDASAFWLNGNTSVNVHCGVAVDSNNPSALSTGGSSSLTASDVYLVGDDQGSPSGSSTITTAPTPNNILRNQIPVPDPYAARAVPAYTCPSYGMSQLPGGVLDPAVRYVYCGGLTLGGSAPSTVTVKPGVYIIAGGTLIFNSKARVTGTGVTFVLTGDNYHGYASLTINGGPQNTVTLTAPTAGPTGGMAFFQDRDAPYSGSSSGTSSCGAGTSQNQINGGSNQLITGAIYFPNQSVCYNGSSSTTGAGKCTQLIARTISFTGNSEFQTVCSGTGVSPISVLTPQLIQ